jgi:hypothetical protein
MIEREQVINFGEVFPKYYREARPYLPGQKVTGGYYKEDAPPDSPMVISVIHVHVLDGIRYEEVTRPMSRKRLFIARPVYKYLGLG